MTTDALPSNAEDAIIVDASPMCAAPKGEALTTTQDEIRSLKERYPKGLRVRFDGFGVPDPWSTLTPGTEGTVSMVDGMGTVHVDWDSGHRLGLIVEPGPGETADRLTPLRY